MHLNEEHIKIKWKFIFCGFWVDSHWSGYKLVTKTRTKTNTRYELNKHALTHV